MAALGCVGTARLRPKGYINRTLPCWKGTTAHEYRRHHSDSDKLLRQDDGRLRRHGEEGRAEEKSGSVAVTDIIGRVWAGRVAGTPGCQAFSLALFPNDDLIITSPHRLSSRSPHVPCPLTFLYPQNRQQPPSVFSHAFCPRPPCIRCLCPRLPGHRARLCSWLDHRWSQRCFLEQGLY